MRPGDNIYFLFLGFIALIVFFICLWLFRKRMQIPLIIGAVMAIALILYYINYPAIKERQHEKDYATLMAYLEERYPDISYIATPETLEEGAFVGEFYVTREDVPEYGLIVHVKGDEVAQSGWYSPSHQITKDTLWQNFYHFQDASFENPIRKITPVDRLEVGELNIVAVIIEGIPAIGAFEYSSGAIKTLEMKEGSKGKSVSVTINDNEYTFFPEDYNGELPEAAVKGAIYH